MPDGTQITVEAQDTTFQRGGNTTQQIWYAINGDYPVIFPVGASYIAISKPAFTPQGRASLPSASGKITVPSVSPVTSMPSLTPVVMLPTLSTPTSVPGVGSPVGLVNLQDIWTQYGPFDTTYETNTNLVYTRSYAIARAIAQSGPTSVRGGTARVGFELAELDTQMSINRFKEIWQNQVAWAGVVINAIKTSDDIILGFSDLGLKYAQTVSTVANESDKTALAAISILSSAQLEYDKNAITLAKETDDVALRFDTAKQAASRLQLEVNQTYDKTALEIASEKDRQVKDYDDELLADNEQYIMAGHATAQSSNNYYAQLNANNQTSIEQFTAGRHYGYVYMTTSEALSGQGVQNGGNVNSFGGSSWR